MSRDSRVTLTLFITLRSHLLHITVSTGGHTSTSISCSLPRWFRTNVPGRFVRLRCKASNCLLQCLMVTIFGLFPFAVNSQLPSMSGTPAKARASVSKGCLEVLVVSVIRTMLIALGSKSTSILHFGMHV